MKKLFALFFSLSMILAFSSCEGDTGPMGPVGPAGPSSSWKIRWFTIGEKDWELVKTSEGDYYRCLVDFPELTKYVYEEGLVNAYRVMNVNGYETQTSLSQSIPYKNSAETWGEIYSFDFDQGSVAFYMYYDDFNTSIPPGECEFRVVLLW